MPRKKKEDIAPEIEDLTKEEEDETELIKKGSASTRGVKLTDVEMKSYSEALNKAIAEYLKNIAGTTTELVDTVVKLGVQTYKIVKPIAEKEGKSISDIYDEIITFYLKYKDVVPKMEEELPRLQLTNYLLQKQIEELSNKAYIDVKILDAISKLLITGLLRDIPADRIESYIQLLFKLVQSSKDVKVEDVNIFNIITSIVLKGMEENIDIDKLDKYINIIIDKYNSVKK